jgi:hypothetical protein
MYHMNVIPYPRDAIGTHQQSAILKALLRQRMWLEQVASSQSCPASPLDYTVWTLSWLVGMVIVD